MDSQLKQRHHPHHQCYVFLILFLFRLGNALVVTTFLFPDEWWQLGEAAYATSFPDTGSYLTWDWRAGIRSFVFPLPLILLLKLGNQFQRIIRGVDYDDSVPVPDFLARHGSKIVMALWMALTDLYTVKFSKRLFGSSSEFYALLFSLTSSFHASRSLRGLSNNAEMACSIVALYYWPFKEGISLFALGVVGLACLIRITALQFWLLPCALLFMERLSWWDRMFRVPLIVLGGVMVGVAVDSYFYGRFTVSWWNFWVWNVLKGVSSYYGRESVFYHVTRSFPLMLNTNLIYFLFGVCRAASKSESRQVLALMGGYLVLSSLQGHKETRFLAPMMPLLVIFCGHGCQQLTVISLKWSKAKRMLLRLLLIGVIVSQLPLAWFFGRVHFNGAYQVVDKLRHRIDSQGGSSVFFLTPCHVTPYMGYLNRPRVHLDFIKCHPPAVDSVMPGEDGNVDIQLQKLQKFDLIVLFEGDSFRYSEFFKESGYVECERSDNSSILAIGSNKSRGDLLIYCRDREIVV